jgi:hypothetical protein
MKTQYNGQTVVVQLGWDRPLSGFYCVVDAVGNQGDDYVYSNLADHELLDTHGMSPDLAYCEGVLQRLGISVPAAMLQAARDDAANNVGNRVVWYDEEKTSSGVPGTRSLISQPER